jgi:hypothetical protein
MIEWHISCDRLMGPTAGPRVYCSGLPLQDDLVLRDTDLERWWGKDTMSMHVLARCILHAKGIKVRVAKSRPEEYIPGAGIQGCSLAFVEFEGHSGKYEGGKSRLRWPHQLPAVLPGRGTGTWWPAAVVSFVDDIEKRIRQDWMESEAAEDMEDQNGTKVVWDFEEEVADGPKVLLGTACRAICATCQEQLQWDIPQGWWFPLRSNL